MVFGTYLYRAVVEKDIVVDVIKQVLFFQQRSSHNIKADFLILDFLLVDFIIFRSSEPRSEKSPLGKSRSYSCMQAVACNEHSVISH